MKSVLQHAPTEDELARLYHELAERGAPSVGQNLPWPYQTDTLESLLALAGDMLRYDPRLLSILLQFIVEHECEINPRRLRSLMGTMRCPQALIVVFEFARQAIPNSEVQRMADYVAAGWRAVSPTARFFLTTDAPGSRRAQQKLGRNLTPYALWGFIGTERPTLDAFRKTTVGRYDVRTRRAIARTILLHDKQVRVADYLDQVDHSISRDQAQKDLRAIGLVPSGVGRGATWKPRRKTKSS